MDHKWLEDFLMLARERNFSKAAALRHVTQPQFSRRIRALELVTDRVVAQSMDFAFMGSFRGGEMIAHAGTVIAVDTGRPVVTPYDNCVLVMPSVRKLRAGVTTVRLGHKQLQNI